MFKKDTAAVAAIGIVASDGFSVKTRNKKKQKTKKTKKE